MAPAAIPGPATKEDIPEDLWVGNGGDDRHHGGDGAQALAGLAGADDLWGDAGDDWIEGGGGNDELFGGDGNDTLWGGKGSDELHGGAGADTFIYVKGEGADGIYDFNAAEGDVIKLYGFSGAGEITIRVGTTANDSVIQFENGMGLVMYGRTVAEITAALQSGALRIETGPAPTAIQGTPGGDLTVTEPNTVIAQGETWTGVALAYEWGSGIPSLINRGTVAGIGFQGAQPIPGAWVLNDVTGVIRAIGSGDPTNQASSITAVEMQFDSTFTNRGLIEVQGSFFTVGVNIPDGPAFQNFGTIFVTSNGFGLGVGSMGGDVVNSGVIDIYGVYNATGVSITGGGLLTNTGTIRADAHVYGGRGVVIDWTYRTDHTIVNSGLIEAYTAIVVTFNADVGPERTIETVINTGEIRGLIVLDLGDDIVINSGKRTGMTLLGEGHDLYQGTLAISSGEVFGGLGDDALLGGANADYLAGEMGDDVILGGGGDDTLEGGPGADLIDGGAGFDTLSYHYSLAAVHVNLAAEIANDGSTDRIRSIEHIIGSGLGDIILGTATAEVFEGLGGNDTLNGGGGADSLHGGRGADALTGGAGNDQFFFSTGDGQDIITDFTAGGTDDRLRIFGYTGYASLVQVGADTRVVLSATDSILLKNVTAGNLTTADFAFSATPLQEGPQTAVEELYSRQILMSDWIVDPGSLFQFAQTAFALQPLYAVASVYNFGTIQITNDRDNFGRLDVMGMDQYLGGGVNPNVRFYNGPTGILDVIVTGEGSGGGGVVIPGDAHNEGYIRVYSPSRTQGFQLYGSSVNVTNSGTIELVGVLWSHALVMQAPANVWNSGQILVRAEENAFGLDQDYGPLNFINSGLLRVTNTSPTIDSIAVQMFQVGPVVGSLKIWNSGTIEADVAVKESREDTTVVDYIYNTGVIRGAVLFTNGREEIYSSGTMVGRIDLGWNHDLFDGRGGTQTGGVHGSQGDDVLLGGLGADLLDGGADKDVLGGFAGADLLTGGAGGDTFLFEVGGGADTITDFLADGAKDVIRVTGYAAYQSLTQQGADTLVRFSATDSILLKNVVAGSLTSANFIFSAAAWATAPTTPAAPPTMVVQPPRPTTPGYPKIGNSDANTLRGGEGDDELRGLGGDDWLYGGKGADRVNGGAGADNIMYQAGDGADVVFGLDGHDHIFVTGYSSYTIEAVGSDSLVRFSASDSILLKGVQANSVSGLIFFDGPTGSAPAELVQTSPPPFAAATVPSLPPVPALRPLPWTPQAAPAGAILGTVAGENLGGTAGDDFIEGRGGDDQLTAMAGNDYIYGGDGADWIDAGTGNDIIAGGFGIDTVSFANTANGVHVDLAFYWAQDTGQGIDQLSDIEVLYGSRFDDTLRGSDAANRFYGGLGSDVLIGGGGDDALYAHGGAETTADQSVNYLYGEWGSDVLYGAGGVDVLVGGDGIDYMTGGAGADVFVFGYEGGTNNRIEDFNLAEDRIDLSAVGEYLDIKDSYQGAVITLLDGTMITVRDVNANQLLASHFFLVPTPLPPPPPPIPPPPPGPPAVNSLIGSGGDDILLGSEGIDHIQGLDGKDDITGLGSDDILTGGLGDDTLRGGGGNDSLNGGDGFDTIDGGAG
ncbi:MAG TPA: hypothetical protein VEA44_08150, partial [Caulobacter sp.]|nr:hypothetical protein [Caulobacter sp.]